MTFVVDYAAWTARPREVVDALDVARSGPHLEFTGYRLVVGMPRAVVVLRVPEREVAAVHRCADPRAGVEAPGDRR